MVTVVKHVPNLLYVSHCHQKLYEYYPNEIKYASRILLVITTVAKVSCKHGLWLVIRVNQNWFTGSIIDMPCKKEEHCDRYQSTMFFFFALYYLYFTLLICTAIYSLPGSSTLNLPLNTPRSSIVMFQVSMTLTWNLLSSSK